jgi:plastocyanin
MNQKPSGMCLARNFIKRRSIMRNRILVTLLVSSAAMLSLPTAMAAQGKRSAKVTPVQSPAAQGNSVTISIPKDSMGKGAAAYGENPKVIQAGTQVTWKNDDSVAHTVTADDKSFDSGFIMPGKSWSHTFSQAGKHTYYCTLHGKPSMSGTIEVK